MKILYENILLDIDLRDSYHRSFIKRIIKKYIGFLIGRPFKEDKFLELARTVFRDNPKGMFVDVGSNIGALSLPIAKEFNMAKVFAVDAHPLPAARFIKNVRLNNLNNVHFLCAAIGSIEQPTRIYSEPKNSGGNSIVSFEGRSDLRNYHIWDQISIPVLRLDRIFKFWGIESCNMLKVDVEGFEYPVIESLGSFLRPDKTKIIVCEYGPEGMRRAGYKGWELVSLLLGLGYKCSDLHSSKNISKPGDIPNIPDFSVTDLLFRI